MNKVNQLKKIHIEVINPIALQQASLTERLSQLIKEPDLDAEVDVATTELITLQTLLDNNQDNIDTNITTRIESLLPLLKPAHHLLTTSDRETIELVIKDHPGYLPQLSAHEEIKKILDKLVELEYWAALENHILASIIRLKDYYQSASNDLTIRNLRWKDDYSHLPKLIKWTEWKAQISIPQVGHYLINNEAARRLISRNEFNSAIKNNRDGAHPVTFRNGIVFKPNPGIKDGVDALESGNEQSVAAWLHLLEQPETPIVAPTEVISIRSVQFKNTSENNEPPKEEFILNDTIVQCGKQINGIPLNSLIQLQSTMKHWQNHIGHDELIDIISKHSEATLLTDGARTAYIQSLIDELHALEPAFERTEINQLSEEPKNAHQLITQAFKTFFDVYPHLYPDIKRGEKSYDPDPLITKTNLLNEVADEVLSSSNLLDFYSNLRYCIKHPELLAGKSMDDLIFFAKQFQFISKQFPGLSPERKLHFSQNWDKKLNCENVTALALATLITMPVDGKGDNYFITYDIEADTHEPENLNIIAIDNDLGMVLNNLPLFGVTCSHQYENEPPMYWCELKCIPLLIHGFREIKLNNRIVEAFLNHSPHEWLEQWLASILYKNNIWETWVKLGILSGTKINPSEKTKLTVGIPFVMSQSLIDLLVYRIKKIQHSLRSIKMSENNEYGMKVNDLFTQCEPVISRYYEKILLLKSGEALEAYNVIHTSKDYGIYMPIQAVLSEHLDDEINEIDQNGRFKVKTIRDILSKRYIVLLVKDKITKTYKVDKYHQVMRIDAHGDHLAALHDFTFCVNDFNASQHNLPALLKLESLGQLHATQLILTDSELSTEKLISLIYQAVHFALPGALKLLLIMRENRLDDEELPSCEYSQLVNLIDDNNDPIWFVFFRNISSPVYAERKFAISQICNLLGVGFNDQLNQPNSNGNRPIFSLVRRMKRHHDECESILTQLVKIGLDFSVREHNSMNQQMETPLDAAISLYLDDNTRESLKPILTLITYGAGLHISNISISNLFSLFFQLKPSSADHTHESIESKIFTALLQQNQEAAWTAILIYILKEPSPGRQAPNTYQIKGVKSGLRLLDDHVARKIEGCIKLLSPSKDTHNTSREIPARHIVKAVSLDGLKLHIKFLPDNPGLEYAVSRLYRHFFHYGLPESELFKFPSLPNGQPLAVLFSQTIESKLDLSNVFQEPNHQAILGNLDIPRFTELFIMHLLTSPEDGHGANYKLGTFINSKGQLRYYIIPIDNERCFTSAFTMKMDPITKKPRQVVNIKSIIYCLDIMKLPLDQTVVKKFVGYSIANKLQDWLNDINQTDKNMAALFNAQEKERLLNHDDYKVVLGIHFPSGRISTIYKNAIRLQKIFKLHLQKQSLPGNEAIPMLDGISVLKSLEPRLGSEYEKAFDVASTPPKRYKHILNSTLMPNESSRLSSAQTSLQVLFSDGLTLANITGKTNTYGPSYALSELHEVQFDYHQIKSVATAVQNGNIQALDKLILDATKQKVILCLKIHKMSLSSQRQLWDYITNRRRPIPFTKIIIKGENDQPITTLSDSILNKLLVQSPKLMTLEIAHCTEITKLSWDPKSLSVAHLSKLSLAHLPSLKLIHISKHPLAPLQATALYHLEKLHLTNLPCLTEFFMPLKKASRLLITNCPVLKETSLVTLLEGMDTANHLHLDPPTHAAPIKSDKINDAATQLKSGRSSLSPIKYAQILSKFNRWTAQDFQAFLANNLLIKDNSLYFNPEFELKSHDIEKFLAWCPDYLQNVITPHEHSIPSIKHALMSPGIKSIRVERLQIRLEPLRQHILKMWSGLFLNRLIIMSWPTTLTDTELSRNETLIKSMLSVFDAKHIFFENRKTHGDHLWYWHGSSTAIRQLTSLLGSLLPDPEVSPITVIDEKFNAFISHREMTDILNQCPSLTSLSLKPSFLNELPLNIAQASSILAHEKLTKIGFVKSSRNYSIDFRETNKSFHLAADNKHLLAQFENSIHLIPTHENEALQAIEQERFIVNTHSDLIALSPLDLTFAWTENKSIIIVSHDSDDCIGMTDHSGNVTALSFSPTNSKLLASSAKDNTLKLWNLSESSHSSIDTTDIPPITGIAFHPQNDMLAASTDTGLIVIFDLRKKSHAIFYDLNNRITAIAYDKSGTQLITLTQSGVIHLFNTNSPIKPTALESYTLPQSRITITDDNQLILLDSSLTISLYHLTKKLVQPLPKIQIDTPDVLISNNLTTIAAITTSRKLPDYTNITLHRTRVAWISLELIRSFCFTYSLPSDLIKKIGTITQFEEDFVVELIPCTPMTRQEFITWNNELAAFLAPAEQANLLDYSVSTLENPQSPSSAVAQVRIRVKNPTYILAILDTLLSIHQMTATLPNKQAEPETTMTTTRPSIAAAPLDLSNDDQEVNPLKILKRQYDEESGYAIGKQAFKDKHYEPAYKNLCYAMTFFEKLRETNPEAYEYSDRRVRKVADLLEICAQPKR